MSTPCIPCGVDLNCDFTDPLDLYSLQGALFYYIVICPPGYDCSQADSVTMDCCDQELTVQIPGSATAAQRTALINDLVDRCVLRQEFCITTPPRDTPNPPNPPNTPPPTIPPPNRTRYFNREIKLTSECAAPGLPSQGTYTYIVKAGSYIADTQAEADRLATEFGKQKLIDTKFCIELLCLAPCAGEAANYSLRIIGGTGPFTAQRTFGYIPAGTAFISPGRLLRYTGTAVTPGSYTVGLRVVDKNGGYWQYPMPIRVLSIGYSASTQTVFVVPAVAASAVVDILPVTNLVVGDVVRLAGISGGKVVKEAGTFEVTVISGPTVTLENLTGVEGTSFAIGSSVTWALDAVPEYETGVAYSFQLPAIGGSGSYAWKITSGSLPTGLEMSVAGLISGTPTDVVNRAFSVQVIDRGCQAVDRSFYRPVATLVGRSVTTVATVRGFGEFFPLASTPPKLYMRRVYVAGMTGNDASGNPVVADEGASVWLTGDVAGQLARAHMLFSGVDRINLAGTRISTATLALYSSCPNSNVPVFISENGIRDIANSAPMPGWCFPYDTSESFSGRPVPTPSTCGACNTPPLLDTTDATSLMPGVNQGHDCDLYRAVTTTQSSTLATNAAQGYQELGVFNIAGDTYNPNLIIFPPNLGSPGTSGNTARIDYKHTYSIELFDEYTDAMALSNATVTNSNSLTAVNKPRTTGFTSVWTTVTYDVKLRNLVFGESYAVTVTFQTDEFVNTVRAYSFTATGSTHTITDTIPTPATGHSVTVKSPTAAYA